MTPLEELTKKIHTKCPKLFKPFTEDTGWAPITLEHVLKVLPLGYMQCYRMDETPFVKVHIEFCEIIRCWDFCKPLSEQSAETIEMIDKLFTNEDNLK